jgi:cell division protein FtsI (penicillin-binding protein 3)
MASTNTSRRRRLVGTILVLSLMITMFVGRLIDIQVVRAETLNADSLGKRSVALPVYGSRGDILDSTGSVLAGTMMRYNVTLSPRNAKEFTRTTDGKKITVTVAQAAAEVAALTGQTGDEIVGIIASALADNPESDYAFVAKKMSVDVFRAVDKLNIPWIYFREKSQPGVPEWCRRRKSRRLCFGGRQGPGGA